MAGTKFTNLSLQIAPYKEEKKKIIIIGRKITSPKYLKFPRGLNSEFLLCSEWFVTLEQSNNGWVDRGQNSDINGKKVSKVELLETCSIVIFELDSTGTNPHALSKSEMWTHCKSCRTKLKLFIYLFNF